MIISLPFQNSKLVDRLHDAVGDRLDAQGGFLYSGRQNLLEKIDERYQSYFEAFRMWRQNPESGHMIGSVMVEIIHKRTRGFSLKDEFPQVGDIEAMNAFILFSSLFQSNLEFIVKLKKKYKIGSLEA